MSSDNSSTAGENNQESLTALLAELERLLKRIQAHTGGETDAVMLSDGPYLLRDAQATLLRNEAMQREFAMLRGQILNALPAHIALLDPNGVIITVNEAWKRFAVANNLRDADFAVGRNYLEVCNEAFGDTFQDGSEAAAGIRRVLRGEQTHFAMEYPCHSPTQKRWFQLVVTPLNEDGNEGVVVMHINITDRVLAEQRLRDQEIQTHQAQRLQSMGQLTGGIAHDFNNLLTVIMGNAEALSEDLPDSGEAQMAKMILDASQRAAELTQRLLVFGRRHPMELKPLDLNGLISSMETLLHRTLGEHIAVEVRTNPALWPAMMDPSQFESTLLNLCLNSRDAMPEGGQLIISTDNVRLDSENSGFDWDVQDGDYVSVAVTDFGSGMTPEVQAQVFEPYFTTKASGKGTGLGLPMVYGFVKQLQGHISIDSQPGEGTTVTLYFPRSREKAKAVATATRAPERESANDECILVVEDNFMVRRYAEQRLRSLGYRVLSAGNGPEALEIIRDRDDIDLLFTDLIMPGGMSGLDLATAARTARPELRVLFTSGYAEPALDNIGALNLDRDLLRKPYRLDTLAKSIRRALDSKN